MRKSLKMEESRPESILSPFDCTDNNVYLGKNNNLGGMTNERTESSNSI